MAVRKGLKKYELSQPSTFFAPPGLLGVQVSPRCTLYQLSGFVGANIHSIKTLAAWGESIQMRILQNAPSMFWKWKPQHPLLIIRLYAVVFGLNRPLDLMGSLFVMIHQMKDPFFRSKVCCVNYFILSRRQRFTSITAGGYRELKLPTMVLACKSDLEQRVDPRKATEIIRQYDVGLVEVGSVLKSGKDRMRRSFDWLLKAVRRTQVAWSYFDNVFFTCDLQNSVRMTLMPVIEIQHLLTF